MSLVHDPNRVYIRYITPSVGQYNKHVTAYKIGQDYLSTQECSDFFCLDEKYVVRFAVSDLQIKAVVMNGHLVTRYVEGQRKQIWHCQLAQKKIRIQQTQCSLSGLC